MLSQASTISRSNLSQSQLKLVSKILALKGEHFSGRLIIKGIQQLQWTFFFFYGRILFATGGVNSVRRWSALVHKATDSITRQKVFSSLKNLDPSSLGSYWELEVLHENLQQGVLNAQQLAECTQTAILWAIFDIWKSGEFQIEAISEGNKLPITRAVDAEQVLKAAEMEWSAWEAAGLMDCQPNQGISVVLQDELQQQTSPAAYRAMMAMLDGRSTVREIAARTGKDTKSVLRSLKPFLQQGILTWKDVVDLPCPVKLPVKNSSGPQGRENAFTIACIDDSPLICDQMKRLVTEAGLNYFSVSDPLRAIATLLKKKPDLIFLDLVMPNTNGYELCTQLRQLSAFREIPIVILTGNDGIFDRVRVKIAGSSGFLSKPISAEVLKIVLQTHLGHQSVTS